MVDDKRFVRVFSVGEQLEKKLNWREKSVAVLGIFGCVFLATAKDLLRLKWENQQNPSRSERFDYSATVNR